MYVQTRTNWISWIALLGYVAVCGILWTAP